MSQSRSFDFPRFALAVAGFGVSFGVSAATVRPADDGRALSNPGMGWTMHYYSNVPQNYGTPLVELPLPDDDGHRRYRVGTIEFDEGVTRQGEKK